VPPWCGQWNSLYDTATFKLRPRGRALSNAMDRRCTGGPRRNDATPIGHRPLGLNGCASGCSIGSLPSSVGASGIDGC
jgi:hypothetical protein